MYIWHFLSNKVNNNIKGISQVTTVTCKLDYYLNCFIPEGKEVVHAGFCLAESLPFLLLASFGQDYRQVLPSLGVKSSALFAVSKILLNAASVVNKSQKTF